MGSSNGISTEVLKKKKLKIESSYDLATPLLGIDLKELKEELYVCTLLFRSTFHDSPNVKGRQCLMAYE